MNIFSELKQRKVLQTAAVYFAVAWGATEILAFLIERIPIFPAWTDTAIAILFVLGFPVTVFLAWMFDVGKNGVRRADPASGLGKGVIMLSLAGLLIITGALSYFLLPQIEAEKGLVRQGDLSTVAVFPIENLTGDPSLGYLGAGLAEDIRQRLATQTDLKVVGRVSLAGFASAGADLAAVRNLLDAGLVLQGSLQMAAGELQVSLSLLESATGRQLWSNVFNAGEIGWGPLRQRIIDAITEQLSITVETRVKEGVEIPEEALQAYFQGLSQLNEPDVADGFFDEAIRLAPDFADAYARKALLRFDMIWLGLQSHVAWEQAEPLIARAKEIDADNLMADIALGHLQWWALEEPFVAVETFRHAEQRRPNNPHVLAGLGTALRYIPFKEEEALAYHRRYLALDPLNPDAHLRIAKTLAFAHRMDEAMAHLDRALELNPRFTRSLDYIANVEAYEGHIANALTTLTRKGQIEGMPSDETLTCMSNYASFALPPDLAIEFLGRVISRKTGPKDDILSWCWEPNYLLPVIMAEGTDRWQEALALAELEGEFLVAEVQDIIDWRNGDNQARYEALLQQLGPTGLNEYPEVWLGNMGFFSKAARILLNAGHTEEALRMATYALPYVEQAVGPSAHFGIAQLVELHTILGEYETALELMERFANRFVLADVYGLRQGRFAPELKEKPQYKNLIGLLDKRRTEETAEIERRTANGEILTL